MATERLKVILEMAAGQYKKEAREAATSTSKIDDAVQKTKTGISAFKSAAVIGGIATLGRGLFSAVEAAEQSASALANTEQIIRQTGGIANVTADDILELSRSLSALTGIEDEVVQEGANVLLTFKNIRNELGEGNDIFDRTAALMLDIGAVMGTDASSAALQLGKALNDPVSQMGALSRAGLTFNDQQKDQIKTLAESGDLLSAQKIILSELETQLGGTAEASADASDKLRNAIGEIGEAVGSFLLDPLETAAAELQHLVGLTNDIERFAAITDQSADSATVLAGALFQVSQQHDGLANFLSISGHEAEQFALAADEITRQWGGSVTELQKVRDGLGFLVESMGLSTEHANILADILDRRLAEAAAASADKVHFLKGEMDEYVESTDDGTDATENFRLELLKQADPIFAYLSDLQDLEEAQDDYKAAVEEFGPASDEAVEAGNELTTAYALAKSSAEEAGESIDTSLPAYQNLQREAGLAGDTINYAADALDRLDGSEATFFVDFNLTPGAQAMLDELAELEGLTPPVTSSGGSSGGSGGILGGVTPKAMGGPVTAGQPYLVGEQGPELFVPHTSGQIVNNSTLTKSGPTIILSGNLNGVDEIIAAVQRANGLNAMMDLAEVYPR